MTEPLPWTFDDGGREDAGFTGQTGDCVTRAIAIATGLPYREVYDDLFDRQREVIARKHKRNRGMNPSPRTGVLRKAYEPFLLDLGWVWEPKMQVGVGTTNHLAVGEVPMEGPVVVSLSRHIAAVVDGVVRDTHDPTRGGTRCVYGWYRPA